MIFLCLQISDNKSFQTHNSLRKREIQTWNSTFIVKVCQHKSSINGTSVLHYARKFLMYAWFGYYHAQQNTYTLNLQKKKKKLLQPNL